MDLCIKLQSISIAQTWGLLLMNVDVTFLNRGMEL